MHCVKYMQFSVDRRVPHVYRAVCQRRCWLPRSPCPFWCTGVDEEATALLIAAEIIGELSARMRISSRSCRLLFLACLELWLAEFPAALSLIVDRSFQVVAVLLKCLVWESLDGASSVSEVLIVFSLTPIFRKVCSCFISIGGGGFLPNLELSDPFSALAASVAALKAVFLLSASAASQKPASPAVATCCVPYCVSRGLFRVVLRRLQAYRRWKE